MFKMLSNILSRAYQNMVEAQTHKAQKFLVRRYSNWWPVTDEEWDELNPKNK